jgi:putative ABC transport system substrate-binding protein
MRRREFVTLLGGAAVAWSLSARAQQSERIRRIGMIVSLEDDDPQTQRRMAALHRGLQQLGWVDGRNIRIDLRSGADTEEKRRRNISELIALSPDVLLSAGAARQSPRY